MKSSSNAQRIVYNKIVHDYKKKIEWLIHMCSIILGKSISELEPYFETIVEKFIVTTHDVKMITLEQWKEFNIPAGL